MAPLMERVPPARLFDEMLKLLLSGHASACLRQLREVGLHKGLLPLLDVILEQPLGERFVTLALAQTDERVLAERPVSPAFLFAALLWHEVLAAWKARQSARRAQRSRRSRRAMDEVLDTQCAKLAITRKLTATMREVWAMQPRFEQRSAQPRLPPARGAALSHGLRLSRAARGERRGARGARGLVAHLPERRRRHAPGDAAARHRAAQAPPPAPPQGRGAGAHGARACVTLAYVGVGSNLDQPASHVAPRARRAGAIRGTQLRAKLLAVPRRRRWATRTSPIS